MADVVGEGAAGRGTRRLRAEVALKTVAAEPGSPDRLRRVLEQALVFGGATLAAVYAPGEDEDLLCLVESAGVPRTFYGLRDSYPRSGRSAVAGALRTGHARWLGPAELAARTESRRTSGRDFFLAALPTHGDEGGGCLLAVSERPGGFDSGDRECLELIADAVAFPALPAATEDGELPADAFSLAMDTGRVEVGDDILALFGLGPDEFDGKVETLLGLTVPEDLPSLMSVVEADHTALGDRDLEFRVLQPTGPPRWLRLRGRLLPGGEGLPARIVGTVADASTLRAEVTDVARVQRLAAALATAGTVRDVSHAVVTALRGPLRADRIALAELENDRLVVTVLDPPDPESWPQLWRVEWRTEWPDAPVRAMPTLAAALREGRAQIWPAGSPLEPALADVGPGGLAVLPLPAGGRMVGACLIGWDAPHDFGPDERALLTASAGLAGQALLRAHAFDAEHELVGMLQRQLLPRRLPRLPGAEAVARYLPTTAGLEVGGDWYDVIPLPDNHVALVIGDVQGHSAAAATLMGQMRTALRAYAAEGHPRTSSSTTPTASSWTWRPTSSRPAATSTSTWKRVPPGACAPVTPAGPAPPGRQHGDRRGGGRPAARRAAAGRLPDEPARAAARHGGRPHHRRPRRVRRLRHRHGHGPARPRTRPLRPRPPRPRRRRPARGRPPQRRHRSAPDALRRHGRTALARELDGLARTAGRRSRPPLHPPNPARLGVPPQDMDAVLLVVSELVTNALVHTDGRVRLDLMLVNRRLRVAVADSSPRTPVKPASISWEATGGRGILLVEAMAATWGTVPVSGGKQVWSEIVLGD